jgi:hypothetical protein
MKRDPILDPPAVVRPAQDIHTLIAEDRLNQLLAEAQAFGRWSSRGRR